MGLYVSYRMSPAQEGDDTDENVANAVKGWKLLGLPLIGLNYLCLGVAIVFMCVGNSNSRRVHPFPDEQVKIYGLRGWYSIVFITTGSIGLIIAFFMQQLSVYYAGGPVMFSKKKDLRFFFPFLPAVYSKTGASVKESAVAPKPADEGSSTTYGDTD